jgi:predicted DsbA family dithiol-disulfide isomerase
MTTVSVDIVLDPVCPWCWLGHRYWLRARDLAAPILTETVYRPFQLDSAVPRAGSDYQAYMKKRIGDDASGRWKQMREHLETAGPEVGIVFNFDQIERRPNTLDAHRLIRWAQGQGLAEPVVEAVFRAYFEERRDIGDRAVLTAIGEEAGLHRDVLDDLFKSDRDAGEVQREEAFYRSLGVGAVPCFIFNGRFAVSGAEAPETLADAVRRAAAQPAETE